MIFNTFSDTQTENVGRALAAALERDGVTRAFIAMRGEMGVGKTVFTRGFASYFGIKAVKSPTYTIVNEYRGKNTSIFHFDLYRIEDADDLYSVGYDDYLMRDGFVIAEWSERADDEIPEGAIFVSFSRVSEDENARIIEITDFEDKKC